MNSFRILFFGVACFLISCKGGWDQANDDKPIPGKLVLNGGGVPDFTKVQPMTGIVVWDNNPNVNSGAHTLEFSYMLYEDIVSKKGVYNWAVVEKKLNDIASRNHQAILRFRYTYVGKHTSVPKYIKNLPDYKETKGISEGKETWFPDWSNQELRDFTLDFYEKFAARYDNDSRLAFLQVGFGLWAEYHIYDGPFFLGKTFPSKEFQTTFLKKLDNLFHNLYWSVSIDTEDTRVTPLHENLSLLDLRFGLFDDSFMAKEHASVNEVRFNFFGDRYERAPVGGEFSYYTLYDQQNVLSPNGPYGESYESFVRRFHLSYIMGNDQYKYQTLDRIKEAGIHTGYKFEVVKFIKSDNKSLITVKNTGTAPIYYDAYLAINGIKSNVSLKTLMPDQEGEFTINYTGEEDLVIACDHLLSGQTIDFKRSF